MNIAVVFRPLREFEERLADLYMWFAELFAADREAADLFRIMSRDELAHARLVEYERRLVMANSAIFGEVSVDLGEIEAATLSVGEVRTRRVAPVLGEALALAVEFENLAVEQHCRGALKKVTPEIARLVDSLGKADDIHVKQLIDFAAKRGIVVAKNQPSART